MSPGIPVSRLTGRAVLPIALALVFASLIGVLPSAGQRLVGTTLEEARRTGEAQVVVAFFSREPFAYFDDAGKPAGLELEMMNLFLHELEEQGIDPTVDWRPYDSFLGLLNAVAGGRGAVFGLGQISTVASRLDRMDFSPPYMQAISVLVTHSDVPVLDSQEALVAGLEERRALTIEGTTLEGYLQELRATSVPGLRIERLSTTKEMFDVIEADPQGTFAYVDYPQFGTAIHAGRSLRRHPVGDRAAEPLAVALPKGSDWAPLLDDFLDPEEGFTTEMAFDLLVRRYLGRELLGSIRP